VRFDVITGFDGRSLQIHVQVVPKPQITSLDGLVVFNWLYHDDDGCWRLDHQDAYQASLQSVADLWGVRSVHVRDAVEAIAGLARAHANFVREKREEAKDTTG
jgi:hypothetical protein